MFEWRGFNGCRQTARHSSYCVSSHTKRVPSYWWNGILRRHYLKSFDKPSLRRRKLAPRITGIPHHSTSIPEDVPVSFLSSLSRASQRRSPVESQLPIDGAEIFLVILPCGRLHRLFRGVLRDSQRLRVSPTDSKYSPTQVCPSVGHRGLALSRRM